MNKEIFRSLVEFHFEQFQMSLMAESISKTSKAKDTFRMMIFIQVKQKVSLTIMVSWFSNKCDNLVISIENTHNMLGGIPLQLDYLKDLSHFAKENDAFIHTDGARLINAAISLNVPLDEICQYTDTVWVSMRTNINRKCFIT